MSGHEPHDYMTIYVLVLANDTRLLELRDELVDRLDLDNIALTGVRCKTRNAHLPTTLALRWLRDLDGLKTWRQVYTEIRWLELFYRLLLCLHDVRQRSVARL